MLAKIGTVLLFLISVVLVGVWVSYNKALTESVVLSQPKKIVIEKGDNFSKITTILLEKNVAIKPLWFKLFAYQKKVSNKLKAGEYELQEGLTMPEILTKLTEGRSLQYPITFPEGWSFKQVLQQIRNNPHVVQTLGTDDFKEIMKQVNSKYDHPEGLFFPDTYLFEKNTTDLALLKKSYKRMQVVLQTEWDKREKDLPIKNAYQALILASIVEKETAAVKERQRISGVFTRRLKTGMLLQTDPTVIYGMGDEYKGNIRRKDLRKRTPYNTYVIKGLPPTPIAMPGKEAIYAALHPAKGNSVYFVAKGNGTHVFSETLRQHNNAVNKYQRKK